MLFEMTVIPDQPKNFLDLAINLFSDNLMPGSPGPQTVRFKHIRDINHLLGLLYNAWVGSEVWSPPPKSPVEVNSSEEKFSAPESLVGYPEENSSFRFRSKAKKTLVSSSSEEWSSPLHSPVARPEKETVPSEARAAYSLF